MDSCKASRFKTLGGTLLIAGSCIGAAMLGLPVLAARVGFIPGQLALAIAWTLMLASGLLLLEVNLHLGRGVSIITMADRTLGRPGRYAAWLTFLFLFYTLEIALISGSGQTLHTFLNDISPWNIPRAVVDSAFVLAFGAFVFLGTRVVDVANRWMMGALIVFYVLLLLVAVPEVQSERLLRRDWTAVYTLLPALTISFGYHNLIPSMTNYLEGKRGPLVRSIVIGSAIPFAIYWLWQSIVMGTVPAQTLIDAMHTQKPATLVMHEATQAPETIVLAAGFGLFAMLTTLIGITLSFVDFLADGFGWERTPRHTFWLCVLVLLPPLILSAMNDGIFLTMLGAAGGLGAVTLFGILPPLMAYQCRYRLGSMQRPLLPGGKLALAMVLLLSCAIFGIELAEELGYSSIPAEYEVSP